ncbi:unnamed protein product [Polarella glacialis]|uniref:Uncharacterized protein n=1 Tax=Polarella glacialis TaxID=89957 RepID=A0A813IRF8_POLGL|nr:unnamed protein product [Polarella glacialis]
MGGGRSSGPIGGADFEEEESVATPAANSNSPRGGGMPAVPARYLLPGLGGMVEEEIDIEKELEKINEGAFVSVKYTHPQLGKIVYEGTLQEKFGGASAHQSYIQLSSCSRYGSKGQLKEQEASKRLMTAFVDAIKVAQPRAEVPAGSGERSRSRSRNRR